MFEPENFSEDIDGLIDVFFAGDAAWSGCCCWGASFSCEAEGLADV